MKIFSKLYDMMMRWAAHRHAPRYLGAVSFAESSFFPIPPDVMLAPMSLAQPERAWYFALLTTITSVLGGLAGYAIGYFAFAAIAEPLIQWAGYEGQYALITQWFEQWGFWAIFIAGFSPIPYKLFTIAGGAFHMALLPFTVASIIGRAARFFLVAALMRVSSGRLEKQLRQYVDYIGWASVGLLAVGVGVYQLLSA